MAGALWAGSLKASAAGRHGIEGQQAPPLNLDYWIDGDGKRTRFDIKSTEGKWVYLKCFQNWCPGCHKYGFPALQRVQQAFGSDDRVSILAVQTVFEGFAINSKSSLRELQLRYQLPVLMGHDAGDPNGDHFPQTMKNYRTGGTPWVVIIDPSGKVVFNEFHINADGFIEYLQGVLS
ncbi:hypothetical protein BGP75_16005 [Motiliproteus sp. MSK22-1]|nr:hypothetical protein BGP75_16005 [Motiliproteus sp. MSK22-1]